MKIIYISTKLLYTIIIIVIFLFACVIIFFNEYHKAIEIYLPITNRIIGIDPGHGGVDPGALSKEGLEENNINLQIALKLKRYIEQSGGIAVLTRDEDKGLYTEKSTTTKQMKTEDLKNRKAIIEGADCEIFLSIHLNSFTKSKYSGAQTFYSKRIPDSQKLAYILQDELRNVLNKDNKRLPENNEEVYLLTQMDMPSVLIEAGFLSNEKEARRLNTSEYQEKIAWSIYVGIMKYFSEMEG
ncbi:N-acetylmuramoyl-L-alanine amidase CwlD [Tissierella creatinini]|nr:N-acetylmuramoyl-L-alanine amidase CwlD [Tissierella creatinini]TJX66028.1 N-acetylmuramoyl-L-alanine amidase CwlD [Soehngenia saccharolytica]